MFIVKDLKVTIDPELLLIGVYADIWNKDTSPRKETAMKNFGILYFLCSPKKSNPFYGYPEEVRREKIFEALAVKEEEFYEEEVGEALLFYEEYLNEASPSKVYYESVLNAAEKLKSFFNTIDFDLRTKGGAPLYKPADITRALQDTDKVITTIHSLKQKVDQELFESNKTTKNRKVNPFESGEL